MIPKVDYIWQKPVNPIITFKKHPLAPGSVIDLF